MLKGVFHMVFNSCGKLVGKCWILHRFSKFCAVYAAHGVFYSCGKAKSGRSGKESKFFVFFDFLRLFPQEFSTHSQKEIFKKAKIGRRPTKKRWSGGKQMKKAKLFPHFFHTSKRRTLGKKLPHITLWGLFHSLRRLY